MATGIVFPPDTQCYRDMTQFVSECTFFRNCSCAVTQNMVDFLNLTSGTDVYKAAYCLNPPSDDSCSFGYCDNPDIAGPLVRIASYITNFCLSIMLFYSPEDAQTALWSQLLTMYSLLLTCGISISHLSLSRLYALLAVVIAGSPLSLYLVLYAAMSFWYRRHRLNRLVGDGQLISRLLVIVAGCIWIALLIFSTVLSDRGHFSQQSCDEFYGPMGLIYVIPFIFFHDAFTIKPGLGVLFILPLVITGLSWAIALFIQRRNIWPPKEPWRPHFGRIWSITGRHYSFIHFMLLVMIPTLYWITVIEISCLIFAAGKGDFLSFGQVLAVFVALPPVVTVVQLYPKLFAWFGNLVWVRQLTRRWRRPKPKKTFTIDSIETAVDDHDCNAATSDFEVLDLTSAALKTTKAGSTSYEVVDEEDRPW